LDLRNRQVELDNGDAEPFDKLLIATGARVRRLPVPGADLPGVFYLRTLADARAIRAASENASSAVVVGAGFIGAEAAASCKMRGLNVTVLEMLPVPLQRGLGDAVGQIYGEIHRERGVDLRLSEGIAEFRGSGRLEQVVTASGAIIDCDLAVVGV